MKILVEPIDEITKPLISEKEQENIYHQTLIDMLDSFLDILNSQIRDTFENHLDGLKWVCNKKVH